MHKSCLKTLCRVCGLQLCRGKAKSVKGYKCSDDSLAMKNTFDIDIKGDDPDIHPTHYCHSCRNVMYFSQRAKEENKEYITSSATPVHWEAHTPSQCSVCTRPAGSRGRLKKPRRPGRPKNVSLRTIVTHIKSISPEPTRSITTQHVAQELICPICLEVVNQPIELTTCSSIVCAECLCSWLCTLQSLSCPCCYSEHLEDYSTIVVVQKVLLALRQAEPSTPATSHQTTSPPPDPLDQILQRPADSPLSPLEQELQTALVKRSLSTCDKGNVLRLKTGGQVSTRMQCKTFNIIYTRYKNISKMLCW